MINMTTNSVVYDEDNRLVYVILHQDPTYVIRAVVDPAMCIRIEKMSLITVPSVNGSVEIEYSQVENFAEGIRIALAVFEEITEGKFPGEQT